MSRVKHRNNIRLLLHGRTETHKWESLGYIYKLKPDISVPAFFAGYNQNIDRQWKEDEWDICKAHTAYLKLKGLFQL